MHITKTTILLSLLLLAGVTPALAYTGSLGQESPGKPVLQPKYTFSWIASPVERCVVKAYPFKTIYGILGKRSDGSSICYVPSRGRQRTVEKNNKNT